MTIFFNKRKMKNLKNKNYRMRARAYTKYTRSCSIQAGEHDDILIETNYNFYNSEQQMCRCRTVSIRLWHFLMDDALSLALSLSFYLFLSFSHIYTRHAIRSIHMPIRQLASAFRAYARCHVRVCEGVRYIGNRLFFSCAL